MKMPLGQRRRAIRRAISVAVMVLGLTSAAPLQAQPQLTVEQRLARIEERLVRIEERQKATEERLTEGFKTMNQRIDDLRDETNRRFEILTKVIVGFMSAVTAFAVVLIGITFWFAKQYKPVAEPRVEWTEKELVNLKERVLRLEARLDAISKATA